MFNSSLSTDQASSATPEIINRNTRKNEKEHRYQQLFAPYHPCKPYTIRFINSLTTETELKELGDVICDASDFIIDTESDIRSGVSALIQVLVVQENSASNLVLLIETTHLPHPSSLCFYGIKNLFKHLFRDGANLYSWGPLLTELALFESYKLFPMSISSNVVNVQCLFKDWFNEYINMEFGNVNQVDGGDDSIVIDAPRFDPELLLPPNMINHIKIINNELWSLQDAVAYVFYKYLSKRETLKAWAIGLDERLPSLEKNYSCNYRNRLIIYAVYDCLSLMEIILFMYEHQLPGRLANDLRIQSLGEYFSYLKIKFPSRSLVEKNPTYDMLFVDDSDEESEDFMAVHVVNERHKILVEVQGDEEYSDINQDYQQGEWDYNDQNNYQVNEQSSDMNQYYDVITNYEKSNTYPEDNNYSMIYQEPISYPSVNEMNSSQEICIKSYQNDDQQPVKINLHSQDGIQVESLILPPRKKKKRSAAAQQRRNQRTSIRHRKNRYNYEISRPANLSVTIAKSMLRRRAVPFLNINIINSILYVGLHSQAFQEYYDKLIPMDLFL